MKYITLIIGLLVVGCEKGGEITIGVPPKAKSVKELTKEDIVGSYEAKGDEGTIKFVLLENGKAELYVNGEKKNEGTWKMAGKEVHVGDEEAAGVYKIEPNGDLTDIARIGKGKREDLEKRDQQAFKKLK